MHACMQSCFNKTKYFISNKDFKQEVKHVGNVTINNLQKEVT
jgi:hypothetical protein